jgi:triosephosphate isomerase (TIM)
MRTPLIAGNWKMNKNREEASALIKELRKLVKDVKKIEILVCPSFTSLCSVGKNIQGSNIVLGAQNVSYENEGPFTGEISAQMLEDLCCKYVILGHSERRHLFGETNEVVNKKAKQALKHNIIPIICVGEALEERESGKTRNVIKKQITESLQNIDPHRVVIAYEPVWAIGTGKSATSEQAQEVHEQIRQLIKSEKTRILYGGSVKPTNVKELMLQQDIDGALVGGASLDAVSFSEIVKF